MKKMQPKKSSKIVPFRRNADFYYARAMDAYDEGNLERALRFFVQASYIDPEDSWNYYNIAMTLGELGRHKEAVNVWETEVMARNHEMIEAYFHLAISYAELGEMGAVRKNLEKYLSEDPYGELALPARQILNALAADLGEEDIYPDLTPAQRKRILAMENRARRYLYKESFDKSIALYKEITTIAKDHPVALNNLSSAYFIAGQQEEAIALARKVTELDNVNIHAWCNLALFYHSMGNEIGVHGVIRAIEDIPLIGISDFSKWALTMGTLGKNRYVYTMLRDLHAVGEYSVEMLHALAISCLRLGKYADAQRYWYEVAEMDEDSYVAHFYLDALKDPEVSEMMSEKADYVYQLPMHTVMGETTTRPTPKDTDYEVGQIAVERFLAKWCLKQEDSILRSYGIGLLSYFSDDEAEEILIQFMKILGGQPSDKWQALVALHKITPRKTLDVVVDSRRIVVRDMVESKGLPSVYGQVRESLEQYLKGRFSQVEIEVAQNIWHAFWVSVRYEPLIRKPAVWAAGLEHFFVQCFELAPSKSEIATVYGVSPGSLKRVADIIKKTLVSPYTPPTSEK